MEISFEFAKKLSKPAKGAAGITLRSVSGGRERCTMILLAASYDEINKSVQEYRLMEERSIKASARGKSLEIRTEAAPEEDRDAISLIFDFARNISFNSDEAADAAEFCREISQRSAEPPLNLDSIELADGSMWLTVTALIGDGDDPDTIYGAYEDLCEKYGVGIVKKRPD